jgi:hypothetical protein
MNFSTCKSISDFFPSPDNLALFILKYAEMSFVESWWETRDPLCFLNGLRTVIVKPFWSGAEQKLETARANMQRYEEEVGSEYVIPDILALVMIF